ncbi:MAG: ACT domain-containing protein [Clostridiaceae bacterium]|jgi:hypothetical protein|nr:ACT domain-containing protein [Clostridiaceae bacterium]
MFTRQISVFIENKIGRLAKVTQILGEYNIDISALSIADTADFGVLRLIVNNPGKAKEVLEQQGFAVSVNNVIAIEVDDRPGGLSKVLAIFDKRGIGIEYMYAFVGYCEPGKALVIIRVENPEEALAVLQKEDVHIKCPGDVYRNKSINNQINIE